MTKDEELAFFELVKGTKLTRSNWGYGKYFIPDEFKYSKFGSTMCGESDSGMRYHYTIGEGFKSDEFNAYWMKYYEYSPKEKAKSVKDKHKCTCDIKLMFWDGCKCGGE